MCGLFGFVSKNGDDPDLRRLEHIALATEQRGRHAFGFAWIDSRGCLKMFKQTGKISDTLGVLGLAQDARMLIGHCRYATHGHPQYNINNHPHPADGGWIVHNGVISRYASLLREHCLHPISCCDSEVIGLLIESVEGAILDRVIEACQTATSGALTMLGLWKNPNRLIALRAGNPLYLGENKRGFYFGSLPGHLPDGFLVRDDTALKFQTKATKGTHAATVTAYDATPVSADA